MMKNIGKLGRKLIEINWNDFDKLCALQCTLNEIASWFDCSEDTIERACKREQKMTFAEYYGQKSAKGRISLRRAQWNLALTKHNVGMLIWLGKQHLSQAEKIEQKQTIETDHSFKIGFTDENDQLGTPTKDTTPTVNSELQEKI